MRNIVIVLLVLLASGLSSSTASALSTEVTNPNDISVFVDDEYMEFTTKPFIDMEQPWFPLEPSSRSLA